MDIKKKQKIFFKFLGYIENLLYLYITSCEAIEYLTLVY